MANKWFVGRRFKQRKKDYARDPAQRQTFVSYRDERVRALVARMKEGRGNE